MKIALIGQSLEPFNSSIIKKAHEVGQEIARHNGILLSGGCWGYPYEAAMECFKAGGTTIAFSPAKNKEEHTEKYGFPLENFTEMIYTGLGIPGRNTHLIQKADAVIMISGQIGTLNEFTLAFHMKKPIGVLEGSGGVTPLIPKIAELCNRVGEKDKVVYSKDTVEMVKRLIKLL